MTANEVDLKSSDVSVYILKIPIKSKDLICTVYWQVVSPSHSNDNSKYSVETN